MQLSDFDFYLPEELIAQEPMEPRDASRLLVLDRGQNTIDHKKFSDLLEYLKTGDTLVLNNTRVIPARLYGIKEGTGAKVEVVLLTRHSTTRWEALVKPGKKIKPGTKIIFGGGRLIATAIETTEVGGRILGFEYQGVFEEILDELGEMPLPPYITKELEDKNRYQTVYAKTEGSAAAPTAGLHFTEELLERIKRQGINVVYIMLHVGLGTFRPVKVENIEEHKMHAEYFEIGEETAQVINETKMRGGKVIAVGTTSIRTLETAASEDGTVKECNGWTEIFIYPGYKFKVVDHMITNFHLPKSTLLMLISALYNRDEIMKAYQVAVEEQYRFFSFGDAMLIL